MSNTLFEIYIHIVFGTINGRNLIPNDAIPVLHGYIAKVFANMKCHDICVGGINNHVHILTSLPKFDLISNKIKDIKISTNQILKSQFNANDFSWQKGYAAFSVRPQEILKVKNYIKNQRKHHLKTSFEKELKVFEILCRKLALY